MASRFDKARADRQAAQVKFTKDQATKSGNSSLRIPDGMKLWQPDKVVPGGYEVAFFPFVVTSPAHPSNRADKEHKVAAQGDLWWYMKYESHKIGNEYHVCPRSVDGSDCPVCEYVDGLKKDRTANKALIRATDSWFNTWYLYIVKVRVGSGPWSDFMLYNTKPTKFHKDFMARLENKMVREPRLVSFWDTSDRSNVLFNMKNDVYTDAEEVKHPFVGIESFDFLPGDPIELTDAIIDAAPALDKMPIVLSYDKLKEIWERGGPAKSIATNVPASQQTFNKAPVEPLRESVATEATKDDTPFVPDVANEPIAPKTRKPRTQTPVVEAPVIPPVDHKDPADENWDDSAPTEQERPKATPVVTKPDATIDDWA